MMWWTQSGADTLRTYVLFIGVIPAPPPWSDSSSEGLQAIPSSG